MSLSSNDALTSQKYLGKKRLVVFLALLSGFVPLSTDIYLPALPTITAQFHAPESLTNLTLTLFFIFFGIGTLIWGPLSDKFGRKPILTVGLAGYAVAGVLCALSATIYQLMFFRALQAIGGSAASTVATAIVKDVYSGKKRESVLALVQSMVVISPAVAPVVGAFLLEFTSWRGIFVAQGMLGVVVFIGAIAFQETLGWKHDGNLAYTMGRLGTVLKNPRFAILLIIFSTIHVTSMAFIASSSYIYQNFFKLSGQGYSFYFAFNALGMLAGPFLYLRLLKRFKRFSIINACFVIIVLSGLLICVSGSFSPWLFAFALLPSTIAGSCSRPLSTSLMLDQQIGDTGSASSLMISLGMVMGSMGIIIISFFDSNNLVQAVGAINIFFGMLCGGLWIAATKRPLLCRIREL